MPQSEGDDGDTLRRRFSVSSRDEAEEPELRSSLKRRLEHTHTFGRFMTDADILRPDCNEVTGDEDELVAACHDVVRGIEAGDVSKEEVKRAKNEVRQERKAAEKVKRDAKLNGNAHEMARYDKGSMLLNLIMSKKGDSSSQQSGSSPLSNGSGNRLGSLGSQPPSAAAAHHRLARHSQLGRAQLDEYASKVMALDEEGESFVQKIHRLFTEAGGHLPSVTIEYRDIEIEADALVGSSSVPSLTNATWQFIKGITRLNRLSAVPLRTLTISGKLKPGRLTLLMGPPRSGKSLFMQMLGGRLWKSRYLRKKGEVRYNGHSRREFNMARAIAMVDQIDQHIANLTVRETLEFAHICQNGFNPKDTFDPIAELRRARAANAGQKLVDSHAKEEAVLGAALNAHGGDSANLDEDNVDAQDLATVAEATNEMHSEEHETHEMTHEQRKQKELDDLAAGKSDADFELLLSKVWGTGVRMEILLRTLGLSNAADTMVGNAIVRGVSGGERKRVTSAEMLVGPKKVLLMDEISTGLDSATTYTVTEFLRMTTHYLHLTTLVSLLQPPPEVYSLFDDIILLSDGLLMFHGPVKEAVPFFESMGFRCPERKDHASFLQEVTTPKGQLQYASPELRLAKGLNNKARADQYKDRLITPVEQITEAFWDTKWGKAMRDELKNKRFKKEDSHPAALPKKPFALTWWEAVRVLLNRQWKLTVRDGALVRGRIIQVVIMALIVGSLFSGQGHDPSEARNYFGVAFLAIMFLSMGAMPELGITFGNKPVLFKQRDNRFYPPSAWSLALLLVRIPFQLMEAILYSCIVYFWVGFFKGAGYFFTFYVICISSMIQMSAVYRLLAAASPNMDIASATGGVVLLLLIVLSGYAIIRTSVPPWWIWAYWLSPFAYSLRAVAINEMTSPAWGEVGIQALESFGFQTSRKWIWIGVGYNFAVALVLTYLVGIALTYMNPPKARPTTPADEVAMRNKIHQEAVKRSRTQRRLKVASRQASRQTSGRATSGRRPSTASQQLSQRATSPSFNSRPPSRRLSSGEMQSFADEDCLEDLKHGDIASGLPFMPVSLVYRKLQYFVPMPGKNKKDESGKKARLELLKGISGAAVPGQLTALMGGSGAGKTTLMDVIAGRKTQGEICGEILVNGFPKVQETWARVVGYVEQMDIHSPQVLVKEALQLSARLRLPSSIPNQEVREYVKDVLDIVELTPLRHTLVGMPGVSGLSVEQRKRLTIAVELVANPSVIFMDEPTSGLDARAAAIVMQSIKNVSRNGRTVMVTIHQPSIDIFESFDALVLLQRGGKLIYSGLVGEQSYALIEYLEAVPGVQPIKAGENPATWMLEVTGGASVTGKSKAAKVDFAEYYKASKLYLENEEVIEHLIAEGQEEQAQLKVAGTYATSRFTQLVALARKFRLAYWRSPSYNLTRMLMTLLICLFYGTVFWGRGRVPSSGINIGNIQNVMGVLYSATNFQGMFNLMNVLPVVGYERSVFYRERAAKMYARASYITAVGVVELPYLVAQTLVFVPISYFMIGFKLTVGSFFYFLLLFFLDLCLFTYFGQFLVFLTPSQGFAQIIASAVQTLWSIFNGFLLPYPVMPKGWRWLNRLSPATWIIYGLAVDQLGENTSMMTAPDGTQQTVSEFMKSYFGYDYSFRWYCVLIIAAYILFFRMGSMLTVRFINYQKR